MGLIFGIGAKPNVNYTKHTRLCGWWIWVPSMLPNHLVDARICQPILKENWKKCNLVESGCCKHTSSDKITCIWLSIKFASFSYMCTPASKLQSFSHLCTQASLPAFAPESVGIAYYLLLRLGRLWVIQDGEDFKLLITLTKSLLSNKSIMSIVGCFFPPVLITLVTASTLTHQVSLLSSQSMRKGAQLGFELTIVRSLTLSH